MEEMGTVTIRLGAYLPTVYTAQALTQQARAKIALWFGEGALTKMNPTSVFLGHPTSSRRQTQSLVLLPQETEVQLKLSLILPLDGLAMNGTIGHFQLEMVNKKHLFCHVLIHSPISHCIISMVLML